MSRTYLTFGDIAGKLEMLRIECTRCARKGRYSVGKLIAQHGRRGNMSKWVSDLRAIVRTGMPLNCTSAATSSAPICRRCLTIGPLTRIACGKGW